MAAVASSGTSVVYRPLDRTAFSRNGQSVQSILKIVVNLQCQFDVVEEVTPPVVHDQRT